MKITVLGAGTIGLSWARLFVVHGHDVVVCDPRPDLAEVIGRLGLSADHAGRLSIETDRRRALRDAEIVQESGPERIAFKREVVADFAAAAPRDALLFSSSSALRSTDMTAGVPDEVAARVCIAHPFNPPHIMPLVELVPGERTDPATIATAREFFTSLGKEPVALNREIPGHAGNRLQKALVNEAIGLVLDGVVGAQDLDSLLKNSLGLRWASIGVFEGMALGGGKDGAQGWIELLKESFAEIDLYDPQWDHEKFAPLYEQVDAAYGKPARPELAAERDRRQKAILDLRGQSGSVAD